MAGIGNATDTTGAIKSAAGDTIATAGTTTTLTPAVDSRWTIATTATATVGGIGSSTKTVITLALSALTASTLGVIGTAAAVAEAGGLDGAGVVKNAFDSEENNTTNGAIPGSGGES